MFYSRMKIPRVFSPQPNLPGRPMNRLEKAPALSAGKIVTLRFSPYWFPALLCATLLLIGSKAVQAAEKLQFNRDIRPILSDRCFKCHGPDKASRKAGLRLDQAEEAYAERKKSGGHAIVPGKPDQSLVCRHIFSKDPDELMPPPD